MLHLADVDGDNWITDLRVSDSQKDYVLDSKGILARAYAYRDEGSRAFFIDERYQRRGYGKAAMKLILEEMKQAGKYHKAVLWYIEGNDAAKMLYEQLGFIESGSIQDEIGMTIDL